MPDSRAMSVCSNCGNANETQAVFCQSCGSRLAAVAPMPIDNAVAYGGFWKRVVAWFIDALVVSAGTGLVMASTFGFGIVAVICGHWLYEALMTSSSWQATLGKRAMDMMVTDMEGRRISFGRATGRYFAKWVSTLTCGIGFVIVAFTEKKQGLHDMIANTVVISR